MQNTADGYFLQKPPMFVLDAVAFEYNTLTFDIDLDRIGGGNVVHIGREILNYSILFLN